MVIVVYLQEVEFLSCILCFYLKLKRDGRKAVNSKERGKNQRGKTFCVLINGVALSPFEGRIQ